MDMKQITEVQSEIESNFLRKVSKLVEKGVNDRPCGFFEEIRAYVDQFERETKAVQTLKRGHARRMEVIK